MAALDELKGKQKAFVLAYLSNGFNGTRAAKTAKYKGTDATLAVVASENLRKPKIKAAIDEMMKEQTMAATEVLARLTMMARGDLGDFAGLSEKELAEHPQSYLLHTIKRRTIPQRGSDIEPIVEIEIKLHDPQAALVHIGKHLGLFTEKVDLTSGGERIILQTGMSLDEL